MNIYYEDMYKKAIGNQTVIYMQPYGSIIKEVMESLDKTYMLSQIEKVIFNNPATIVIWADKTKTVVKCDGEKFDPEKGLAMAISKKFLGNNKGYYYELFKKWVPEKKKKHSKKEVTIALKKVREDYDKNQAKKNK